MLQDDVRWGKAGSATNTAKFALFSVREWSHDGGASSSMHAAFQKAGLPKYGIVCCKSTQKLTGAKAVQPKCAAHWQHLVHA
eukprot:164536-Amphidinium_carterae.3